MLQSMRKMAHSWMFKWLMCVLTLSLIWSLGGTLRSGVTGEATVAKVGSHTITTQDLNLEFRRLLAYAQTMMGRDLSAADAKKLGLMDTALNNAVQRSTLDQETKRLKIEIAPEIAYAKIAAQPTFRNKDGSFNKEAFKRFLSTTQLNERDFAQQIARDQVIDVFSATPPVTQTALDAIVQALAQKRILRVMEFKNSAVALNAKDADTALRAFYDQHGELFTAPEYRTITVASLSVSDITKDITVSDADVEKEYNANQDRYSKPERRDLIQVVVQNEEKAKKLADDAAAKGSLNLAAKASGYEVIPLSASDEKSLLPELVKPVFALAVGEITPAIKSDLGWHVLQVKKLLPAEKTPLKEVKETIRTTLLHDQAIESATKIVNNIDDELAAGHTLDDIAGSQKLTLNKLVPIDPQGLAADGKKPANLPSDGEALKTAFAQNSGEVSPIMDDRHGHYTIVRTDEVTPSKVRPFDEVKAQVKTLWQEQTQAKLAQERADKIAQAIRDGKGAMSAAEGLNLESRTSKPITMGGSTAPDLPSSALKAIYKMKKDEVITAHNGDSQMILQLARIEEGSNAEKDALRTKIGGELSAHRSDELLDLYGRYLGTLYPVNINRDAMTAIMGQGS